MSTVEQWSVWTARVYFEDQSEVFKVRPVVIYGNRAWYGRIGEGEEGAYRWEMEPGQATGKDSEILIELGLIPDLITVKNPRGRSRKNKP